MSSKTKWGELKGCKGCSYKYMCKEFNKPRCYEHEKKLYSKPIYFSSLENIKKNIGSLLGLFLFVFFSIVKVFKDIKIYQFRAERIGHLASNNDLFLRRLQLMKQDDVFYICIAGEISNFQLFSMYVRAMNNRGMFVFQSPFIYNFLLRIVFLSSIFRKSGFFVPTLFKPNEFYIFNNTRRNIYFTEEEEERGRQLLREMGIGKDDWFVCFHARDSEYLNVERKNEGINFAYHNYRDCSVKNYLDAAEYITSKGGYAIRMGAKVERALPDISNSKVVDYATKFRSDFGDIYLSAKCRFFLGNNAGIYCVPYLFHTPVIEANACPLDYIALPRKNDMFIPKKLWLEKENRYLTFREILSSQVGRYTRTEKFDAKGLKNIENTSKEILDVTIEMYKRLNGTWKETEDDEKLQEKFWSLFTSKNYSYGCPAKIGTEFLKNNKNLLE